MLLTLEVTIYCNSCDSKNDEPLRLLGTRNDRDVLFMDSGWKKVNEDVHIGSFCLKLYNIMHPWLHSTNKEDPTYQPNKIDNDAKPGLEFLDNADYSMAYKSRYCRVGSKTRKGISNHEIAYHRDQFTSSPMRSQTQMKKTSITGSGKKVNCFGDKT